MDRIATLDCDDRLLELFVVPVHQFFDNPAFDLSWVHDNKNKTGWGDPQPVSATQLFR
jgi:hypothetical protein